MLSIEHDRVTAVDTGVALYISPCRRYNNSYEYEKNYLRETSRGFSVGGVPAIELVKSTGGPAREASY